MKEMVNHPDHYNKDGRKECWDEMLELFGAEAVVAFDVLSAYKYYYRCGSKDGNPTEQEKAKIRVYMEHASKLLSIYDCDNHYAGMLNDLNIILKEDNKWETN